MEKMICVVGGGRWGTNHIRTLHELGRLGGIVEKNRTTLAVFHERYPKVAAFEHLTEALKADFAGFTVATPAETHFDVARRIIEHKKHVLVEKPLTLTTDDARTLRRLACENGVNLMVGHLMLFHPAVRKIKALLDAGKIGKLQYLYSNRLNLGTVRTEENILWSFAPHDISIFQYLIGAMPTEIVSRGGAFVQPHLHDSTMTFLAYPGNVAGHIFVSWLHPFKEHRLVAVGSKGMLSFDDSSESKDLLFYEKGIDFVRGEPVKRDGATETIAYDRAMPLTEELKYFAEHLDGRPIEIAGADNGVEVLEILARATESLLASGAGQEAAASQAKSDKSDQADKADRSDGSDKADKAAEEKPNEYFVHPTSVVDANVTIGKGTKIWHFSHVQSGARIGEKCAFGQNVNVANNVKIGSFVKVQNNVSIYEGVELEDYVFCGPSMVFTNVMDPRSKYPQRGSQFYVKTLVKEGASIGANATIVCGATLGRHCFIGAGAVVTKDVPDYALMVGVPARQRGWVCECGEILGAVKDRAACPRCKREYAQKDGALVCSERGLPPA